MQYRLDKKSQNELSVLGFGCMRLPRVMGKTDIEKSQALIMDAIEKGINFFDCAYLYPGSEVTLGTILEKNQVREKVYISTKLPLFKCQQYEDFDRLFNEQLRRLKTNYVDYYFMHNFSTIADWERLCSIGVEKWIEKQKKDGKIKQIGFSFHGAKGEFTKLVDAWDWQFAMIQYNYVNTHYQAGTDGLKYAHAKGLSVFVMEPLLGGRLANNLPKKAQDLFAAADPNSTPASWGLRWVLNHPEVTLLLSGMNELEQIAQNTIIATQTLPNTMTDKEMEIIQQVEKIFSDSYKIPCTGCNYCLPCPKGINIPDSFMAYNTSYSINRFAGIQQYATTTGGFSPTFSVRHCTDCKKCEKECPQDIKISDRLKDVAKRMEPLWYRAAMGIARRVMS